MLLPPSPAQVSDLILQTREHVQALGWRNGDALYTELQVRALLAAERRQIADWLDADWPEDSPEARYQRAWIATKIRFAGE